MRYDKRNKKLESLNSEVARLRAENEALRREADSVREILTSTLHEVRRFSAQVSKFAERLSRETEGQHQLNQTALSVFYTAGMISSRLAYTDIELNPRALEGQIVVRSGIYKKFDKARRVLAEQAREKSVAVRMIGESRVEIDALPVFELLPFVILENAIKYSPTDQEVQVRFDTDRGRQIVTVSSMGPLASQDEVPNLMDKGVRGRRTESMPGEGLGLFLAKRVCEYHGVKIRLQSGPETVYQVNGIAYAAFSVELCF